MKLSNFSRGTLRLGFALAVACLLAAAILCFALPYTADPHHALMLLRSLREAALALCATAVCAALLCDIIIKKDLTR